MSRDLVGEVRGASGSAAVSYLSESDLANVFKKSVIFSEVQNYVDFKLNDFTELRQSVTMFHLTTI